MKLTIDSIKGRSVVVTAAWDNEGDPISASFSVPNVTVEDLTTAVKEIYAYVMAMYEGERAKRANYLAANPTPDPNVLATIGQTFDDESIAALLKPVGIDYA